MEPRRGNPAAYAPDEAGTRAQRVLIIENDPESMRPLCRKLMEAGFQVTLLAGSQRRV